MLILRKPRRTKRSRNKRIPIRVEPLESRLLLTINAELSQAGNAIITAVDAGDVDDAVQLSIVGGDTLRVESLDGVQAGPGFTALDANTATVALADIIGGEIQVSMFDGDDLVEIESSPTGILTLADTGAGSDEVRVGSSVAGLDGLIGAVELTGGDHGSSQSQLTIKGDSNSLESGDRLTISDAAVVSDHEYELSELVFERTTLGADTAPLRYGGFESVDFDATSGSAIIDITDTPTASRVTVTMDDGDDQITIEDTGLDSNTVVTTAGGADSILIRGAGDDGGAGAANLGSFIAVAAGDGPDQITLERNGTASRVQLSGEAGDDQINIISTVVDSVTLIEAGSGSDTVNVSSNAPAAGHLDNIQGEICIDGGGHEPGQATLTIKDSDNSLDRGDVLNISDAFSTDEHFYSLSAGTFRRSTLVNPTAVVEYESIETLNIDTTEGSATVLISGTAPAVNTNVTTQDAVDRIAVDDTGSDSNVTILTGGDDDVVAITDTGEDGGSGALGLGSFLRVDVGAGLDTLTVAGNGIGSRLHVQGQGGADTINVQATSELSATLIEAGNGSDTINVSSAAPASGNLDGIQGRLCIDGQDHGFGQSTLSIKGDENSLDRGDVLTVSDAAATADHTYDLGASIFQRIGFGQSTAPMEYLAIETLNIDTTQGVATLLAATTAAGINTNIITQDAADLIALSDTGVDSNVSITTDGGDDQIAIDGTGGSGGAGAVGLGSFVRISGGDGDELMVLEQSGASSRVELEGQGGADELRVGATAIDSVTSVQGGTGSDRVIISSAGILDGIEGRICVEGQDHDAGETTTLTIDDDANSLDTGDVLQISDAGNSTSHSYRLTESAVSRTTLASPIVSVEYQGIETVELLTSQSERAIVVVANTAAASNTFVTTGADTDLISVVETGADSNVTISTGDEADSIEILDTGLEGGAGAAGLGSFVEVQEGDAAGTFNLVGNGVASRTRLVGDGGEDSFNVRATSVDSITVVEGGLQNDSVQVSSNAPSPGTLAGIQGTVRIDGQDHDPGDTFTQTIKGDDNSLDLGDSLRISDALEVDGQSYELTADSFRRTTDGAMTALIQYFRIEDLQITTTEGAADVLITSTAAQANLRLLSQESDDRIEINDTGVDSNVLIQTAGGRDTVVIRNTGEDGGAGAANLGSFLRVVTDESEDWIELQGNGVASRLLLDGAGGMDQVFVDSTALESAVEIFGGNENDQITVGRLGLDPIIGQICVDGGLEDALAIDLSIKDRTNNLAAGDQLLIYDDLNVVDQSYELTASSFRRITPGSQSSSIEYLGIELLDAATTEGAATVQVLSTADAVNTFLTTQDADDRITIDDTGLDSNVTVLTARGDDEVLIRDTGEDGGQGAVPWGSFLVVSTDDGQDSITLEGNGVGSSIELMGQGDSDVINLRSTAVDSLNVIETGLGNDVVNVAPADLNLDAIQGILCVSGGDNDLDAQTTLTIKGESNALPTGDVMNVSDAGATDPHNYRVEADEISRDNAATILASQFESVNITTTQGVAEVLMNQTVDRTNMTLTTQDADDVIRMSDIGNSANVVVSTGAGQDDLELGFDSLITPDTGSFLQVRAGDDGDDLRLVMTGDNARVQLSGENGADQITVASSTETTLTVVAGGAGNDQINLGPDLPALRLLGLVCVDGGDQDPLGRMIVRTGQVEPGIPYSPDSRFVYEDPVAIDSGDTLNVFDQNKSEGHDYGIDADSVSRDQERIAEFEAIETINLKSGQGSDQLTVELPVTATVITFDAGGQTEVDRLMVQGDELSNQVRIANLQDEGSVRSPFEIAGVELIQVRGGSLLETDNDTIINDTGVPALLLGEGGDDVHVGGTGTDVAIGGTGIEAMFGNSGDDFLVPDVSLLSVDGVPAMVRTEIEIHPTGGDLIFGNRGDGNDLGAFDEAVALVPPGSPADFVDEVEFLIEEGAVKGVWSWLLARFPEPSESSIQELVDRAISRLLSEAGAAGLEFAPEDPVELGEPEATTAVGRLDLNGDGSVSPIDALLVFNQLNQDALRTRESTVGQRAVDLVLDVNGDGFVSPVDALHVINYLNEPLAPIPTAGTSINSEYAAAILALDKIRQSP